MISRDCITKANPSKNIDHVKRPFQLGLWLAGDSDVAQSEANLENPCFQTWSEKDAYV